MIRRRYMIDNDDYLTIEALEDGLQVKFSSICLYSTDKTNWIVLRPNTFTSAVKKDTKFYFKREDYTSSTVGNFTITHRCNISGDCESLLFNKNDNYKYSVYECPDAFNGLFRGCTTIVDASKLLLPAIALSPGCYFQMFQGCSSLTTAPELPATTLADVCYAQMFQGCSSLTTAPELPATTLADYCYHMMFEYCSSLTTAPELPATALADYCYGGMFQGCSSLTTAPELPAMTLKSSCYYSMFAGCSSLTTAPELPAMTLADYCYFQMFQGCSSLTTAPELPATTLKSSCYSSMFAGCSSLTTAPELPAMTLKSSCYYSMFAGCSSLTTTPALPAETLADYCYANMFAGCSSLTTAPELPAMTLKSSCYSSMFQGCSSLTTAPELPAKTLADYCYADMFYGCTSLTTTPALPAETLADYCYANMFAGCSSLTTAPELPAMTLADYCYFQMFYNCTSLTTAPELKAEILAACCYEGMFKGCTNLNSIKSLNMTELGTKYSSNWVKGVSQTGEFIKSSMAAWETRGIHGIPDGWNIKSEYIYDDDPDINTPYLTIESLEDNNTISLNNPYAYSFDKVNWANANSSVKILFDKHERVYFKKNSAYNSAFNFKFAIDKKFNLLGNCNSMLFGDDAKNNNDISDYPNAYYQMFSEQPVVNVALNFLPATTLSHRCYYDMFANCSELLSAPNLPAKTLSKQCYCNMFAGCSKLVQVPVIDVEEFDELCYSVNPDYSEFGSCYQMFRDCTSITDASSISLDTHIALPIICYQGMFQGCTNLTSLPSLHIYTSADTQEGICYYMFRDCTSITDASSIVIDSVSAASYYGMFQGCTNLIHVPTINTTILAPNCYQYMFRDCTSITDASSIIIDSVATLSCHRMFSNCSSLEYTPLLNAETLASECYQSMFEGCIKLKSSPKLPATELVTSCYSRMFYGCTNLNYIEALFETPPGDSYTYQWVEGVAEQGIFIKADNTAWDPESHRGVSGIPENWVVYIESENNATLNNYLIIEPLENLYVQFSYDCKYSLNGYNWLDLPAMSSTITVNVGQKLYFKATGLTPKESDGIGQFTISGKCNLLGNCNAMLFGDDAAQNNDISAYPYAFKNLFAYNDTIINVSPLFLPATKLATSCYENMFYGCTSLQSSPNLQAATRVSNCYNCMLAYTNAIPTVEFIDFNDTTGLQGLFAYTKVTDEYLNEKLPKNPETGHYCLPATILSQYCYKDMFRGCTKLTKAPELPAMTLKSSCYSSMFYGCTSLTTPPELPAMTLASYCYYCMFFDCTSLSTAPELPATALADVCYGYMFYNTALQETPELPATILANYCYEYMFQNCKSLITAKNLNHITKLSIYCCDNMFYGCTSLETAPIIPNNINMPTYCYSSMFEECTSLKEVQDVLCESEDVSIGQGCFSTMFRSCKSLTKAPELRAKKLGMNSYYYMFTNCDSLTIAPNLPATELNDSCYEGMFAGCSSLTTAPELPAMTLKSSCYSSMFQGCSSLTTAPELPAMTLASDCYSYMFYNCTNLQYQKQGDTIIEGIKLPAILLVSNCYNHMFYLCRKINCIYASFINEPGDGFTTNWVAHISSDGTFIKSKNTMWDAENYRGVSGIPSNWVVEESDDDGIIYNPSKYLTIESIEKNLTISFSNDCKYSFNENTWNDYISGTTITISPNQKVYFKNVTAINNNIGQFTIDNEFNLYGSVMSMLFDVEEENNSLENYDYIFKDLFKGCTGLKSVSHDFLSASILSKGCYEGMFEGCTSLRIAPELLAENLVEDCYKNMFKDCESLEYIKIMSSTDGDNLSYTENWVNGVTTNNGIFIHADNVIWNEGNNGIPSNWIDKSYSDINKYMTIQSLEDDNELSYTRNCEYSYDTITWDSYTTSESPLSIILKANQIIYFKSESAYINDNTGVGTFVLSKKFRLYGNCNSMLFGDNTNIDNALKNYAFYKMFINSPVTKVSTDFLPALIMSSYCYSSMFEGCYNLKNTPNLPAITLGNYCYYRMFYDCYSLEDVIENLPATTLKDYSYSNMFKQCISLKIAPEINAEILSSYSCSNMFANCVSLTKSPTNLKATNLSTSCYSSMFESCVSLTKSPIFTVNSIGQSSCSGMFKNCKKLIETNITFNYDKESYNSCSSMFYNCFSLEETLKFSATTLSSVCYEYMYYNCKSLKIAHDLPGIKLMDSCYFLMFANCKSLVNAPKIYATDGQSKAYTCYQMFYNCNSLENVPDLNVDNWGSLSCYTMFYNCTSLKKAPKLTAKKLSSSSYYQMFYKCTSLTTAPDLNVTELTPSCFNMMFATCPSLETAPELPATILSNNCYTSMFRGCTSLKVAPELPAKTLVTGCYKEMFNGCSKLNYIKALFQTTPDSALTGNWVYGLSKNGIFVKANDSDWDKNIIRGNNTIPSTWTIYNESEINFKETDYLIMEALDREFSASFSNECEYSLDGLHWETLSANTPTIAIHTGCKLYFRGNLTPTSNGIGQFSTTGKFNLYGNCNAMLFGDDADIQDSLANYSHVYKGLFADQPVVNVSSDFLHNIILSTGCYEAMFKNCTDMETSPKLPATTLVEDCYKEMFQGCTKLNSITALFETPPGDSYTYQWVEGVAEQGIFIKADNTAWDPESHRGVSGIPNDWYVTIVQ